MVRMNALLRKFAKKVLLTPKVKNWLERVYQFYAVLRVKEGLDTFKGESEFLKTIEGGVLDITETLTEGDAKALTKVIQMVRKEKMTVVEVGSWKGFSTSVLAKMVADYHGSVYAVDHWMGNEGTWNEEIAKTQDVYSIFKRNIIVLGLWDTVHPLVMDSLTACEIIADGILDLVFIDADHRYENFKKDISCWLPKLREGGILCGHDCEGYYSEYPAAVRKVIDEHLGDDYIPDICHPGVVKGLHEYFKDKYSIMPDSIIWYHIKKDSGSTR